MRRRFGSDQRPALLGGFDDSLSASGAEPSLWFGGGRRDSRPGLLPGLGPPFSLRLRDSLASGGTHSPPALGRLRGGGGFSAAAGYQLLDLANAGINPLL